MTVPSATSRDPQLRVAVRAAGGLVVRRGGDDTVRVVLVHRPRYDDWSSKAASTSTAGRWADDALTDGPRPA
jgi:hypothetical protein